MESQIIRVADKRTGSGTVDPRALNEAIAAVKQRAATTSAAKIEAAQARLRQTLAAYDADDSRANRIAADRVGLDFVCLTGFADMPRKNLWRIVNRLGASLGKTGLDREPYVRQQLAAALVYMGWNPSDDDTAYRGVAGVRASIVADPDDFPTLWCRDSGSDWAEYSSEDMSPEAQQVFTGCAVAQLAE